MIGYFPIAALPIADAAAGQFQAWPYPGWANVEFSANLKFSIDSPTVLWGDASAIEVIAEWQDIVLEVEPNIGVTTE